MTVAFKFPTFEERHAAHIRPEVLALARRAEPITLAEYEAGRWNSYERHILNPRLDDEAFAHHAEHNIANCYRGDRSVPYAVYDDALVGFVAPEMLRRWRAALAAKATPPPDTLTITRAEAETAFDAIGCTKPTEERDALLRRLLAFVKKEA